MQANTQRLLVTAGLFVVYGLAGGCSSICHKSPPAPVVAVAPTPTAQAPSEEPKPTKMEGMMPTAPVVIDPTELLIDADVDPLYGDAPLTVHFSAEPFDEDEAVDPKYTWNFGDGSPEASEANPTHVYERPGDYNATIKISESGGKVGTDDFDISVFEKGAKGMETK